MFALLTEDARFARGGCSFHERGECTLRVRRNLICGTELVCGTDSEIGASVGLRMICGTDSEIGASVSREHLSFKVFDFRR